MAAIGMVTGSDPSLAVAGPIICGSAGSPARKWFVATAARVKPLMQGGRPRSRPVLLYFGARREQRSLGFRTDHLGQSSNGGDAS